MAYRLWFPASSPASETTTPDAGWNFTTEVSRHNAVSTKGSSAVAAGTLIGPLAGTAAHKGVDRMYFSPALAAQTISGTVSMMLMTREGAGTDNVDRPWCAIFVVRGNTKVSTLLALGTRGATTEFVANATHRTCTFANAAALTSFACQAGDKILVEIGAGNNASGTSPEFSCKWGESATDATLGDNATTADRAGWIEFSATLTEDTPAPTPVVAGTMTSTATSSSTMAALRAFVAAVMTTIAQSVTSLLALFGILSTQTTQALSATSTTSEVISPEPIDAGAMTPSGSSSITMASLVGHACGSQLSQASHGVSVGASTGRLTSAAATTGAPGVTMVTTVETPPQATIRRRSGVRGLGRRVPSRR